MNDLTQIHVLSVIEKWIAVQSPEEMHFEPNSIDLSPFLAFW